MTNNRVTAFGRVFDLDAGVDISIPLRFHGEQPGAFGVEKAAAEACVAGDIVGDTRRGGSCNFEKVTLVPHCNGTHTECIGHITDERIAVTGCLKETFIQARLVTVEPGSAGLCSETYSVSFGTDDRLITKRGLLAAGIDQSNGYALIIRTLPNDETKLTRRYLSEPFPPYFTSEAMRYVVECGFTHLLIDTPSIDRMDDDGHLSNHRIFWNLEPGNKIVTATARNTSTVTEMIYVSNEVTDGEYLLNLQIAPFVLDASPSRPVIFPVKGRTD